MYVLAAVVSSHFGQDDDKYIVLLLDLVTCNQKIDKLFDIALFPVIVEEHSINP